MDCFVAKLLAMTILRHRKRTNQEHFKGFERLIKNGLDGIDEFELVTARAHHEHGAAVRVAPVTVGIFKEDERIAAAVVVEIDAFEFIQRGNGCAGLLEEGGDRAAHDRIIKVGGFHRCEGGFALTAAAVPAGREEEGSCQNK